jgi:dTDP-4-dehydrorhamnose reductase
MRIAVTGAGGGLGRAFLARGAAGHEVLPFSHDELAVEDSRTVMDRLGAVRPDVVLHLAAMTSVDDCERDPQAAFRVNVRGTLNVAEAARAAGGLLVALSTDYVFDGEKEEPYDELDDPNPLNAYGGSKLRAERAAAEVGVELLIVRTSWVFGAPAEFVRRSVERLAAGEDVGGIVDQTGTPTYAGHLAERLVPLIESGSRGVVHLAGPEPTTWFGVLARARELGDLPGQVFEQKSDELGRLAPRPRNSALSSVVLPETEVPPMPPLDDALGEVLADVR